MGAASVHLVYDINSLPAGRDAKDYDFVMCENPATHEHLKRQGVTCCTLDWVKQCIIMGREMPALED